MLFPASDEAGSSRLYPQVTMAALSFFCIYTTWLNRRYFQHNFFFKYFYYLVVIAGVYIIYPIRSYTGLFENVVYFLKAYMAIVFMMTIVIFLRKDENRNLKYVYLIYAIQVFYALYSLIYDKIMFNLLSEIGDTLDSNAGFILLPCIPFSLLIPKKIIGLAVLLVLVVACIVSGQRSAALTAVAIVPFCLKFFAERYGTKRVLLILIVMLLLALPFIINGVDNLIARQQYELDNGSSLGSGRGEFWLYAWNGFWSGNILQMLFGYGTLELTYLLDAKFGCGRIGAHNGWLEHLYAYGLFGEFFYFMTVFSFWFQRRQFNKYVPEMKGLSVIIFLCLLIKGSTSHGNWDISVMPVSLAVAVLYHSYSRNKTILKKNACI